MKVRSRGEAKEHAHVVFSASVSDPARPILSNRARPLCATLTVVRKCVSGDRKWRKRIPLLVARPAASTCSCCDSSRTMLMVRSHCLGAVPSQFQRITSAVPAQDQCSASAVAVYFQDQHVVPVQRQRSVRLCRPQYQRSAVATPEEYHRSATAVPASCQRRSRAVPEQYTITTPGSG